MLNRRKAFIFTIDALFALALVTALVALTAFVAFTPPRNQKLFELEQLGFDSLALEQSVAGGAALVPGGVSDVDFARLTGLQRFHALSDVSSDSAAVVARACFYVYPPLCECVDFASCVVSASEECLVVQDLGLPHAPPENYSEVWVTP